MDEPANLYVVPRGIVGPLTVTTGLAFVREDPSTGLSLYHDISDTFATAHHPGPRYWMLWPGIIGMVAVSLAGMSNQKLEVAQFHGLGRAP